MNIGDTFHYPTLGPPSGRTIWRVVALDRLSGRCELERLDGRDRMNCNVGADGKPAFRTILVTNTEAWKDAQ